MLVINMSRAAICGRRRKTLLGRERVFVNDDDDRIIDPKVLLIVADVNIVLWLILPCCSRPCCWPLFFRWRQAGVVHDRFFTNHFYGR